MRLWWLAMLIAAASWPSCSEDKPSPSPPPSDWDRRVVRPTDQTAAATRQACGYAAGALPDETSGQSAPGRGRIPVDHIFVVMMEDRSFDHYFQAAREHGIDVDVAPPGYFNPDSHGNAVVPFHSTSYCFVEPRQDAAAVRAQINGGRMDGFVLTSEGFGDRPPGGGDDLLSGARVMGYYAAGDLPFLYWAAQNFSVADRYFAALPGPTAPNRMFLYAASSFGITANHIGPAGAVTIFDRLETRGVAWAIYASSLPGFSVLPSQLARIRADHVLPPDRFFSDIAAGRAPQVAFVDPNFQAVETYDSEDGHPPAVMQVSQRWLARLLAALMASPSWSRSVLFITWDHHGGLFDHVAPPPACPPDAAMPATFSSYGLRVPFLAISPYARPGFVSHRVYDHTSILRFIEARFAIPALTARDANAEVPWEMFDFARSGNARPASAVPAAPVDPDKLAACKAIFAP